VGLVAEGAMLAMTFAWTAVAICKGKYDLALTPVAWSLYIGAHSLSDYWQWGTGRPEKLALPEKIQKEWSEAKKESCLCRMQNAAFITFAAAAIPYVFTNDAIGWLTCAWGAYASLHAAKYHKSRASDFSAREQRTITRHPKSQPTIES